MLHLTLSTTLSSTERVITCEDKNNVHRLSCGMTDGGYIRVERALCNGKTVCEVNIQVFYTPNLCPQTYKYLDTTYTCLPANRVIVCEHSIGHLQCDQGQVITVYGADYGRRDQTTCSYRRSASQIENVHCSGPTSKVAESCNGKNSCTAYASNSVFGDPCRGTYKYLEVAYTCVCKYLKGVFGLFHC
ncbi:L-rhamnose-binding lectin SML-like [Diretmus argenteus]